MPDPSVGTGDSGELETGQTSTGQSSSLVWDPHGFLINITRSPQQNHQREPTLLGLSPNPARPKKTGVEHQEGWLLPGLILPSFVIWSRLNSFKCDFYFVLKSRSFCLLREAAMVEPPSQEGVKTFQMGPLVALAVLGSTWTQSWRAFPASEVL